MEQITQYVSRKPSKFSITSDGQYIYVESISKPVEHPEQRIDIWLVAGQDRKVAVYDTKAEAQKVKAQKEQELKQDKNAKYRLFINNFTEDKIEMINQKLASNK